MKLVDKSTDPGAPSNIETLAVSNAQFAFLGDLAHQLNPDMPMEFAGAHVIRTLLERFEDSGIDLTAASSEEEVTRIAANGLSQRR
jgi:hypothetical protein